MKHFLLSVGLLLLFVSTADGHAEDFTPSKACTMEEGSVAVKTHRSPLAPATPSTRQGIHTPPVKVPAKSVRQKDGAAANLEEKATSPPLDLPTLENRLRETKAIGVFTKITLKNQVDDLVGQFRDYHGRRGKTTLAELRQRYDMLVLKLLSLLQDSDSTLARTIVVSREAIWNILTDPAKFATI